MNRRRETETKQRRGQTGQGGEGHAAATSKWEWVVGALGFVLVLAAISYLAHQALTANGKTPSISVEVVAVTPTSGGYLVRFRARNMSGGTAAALRIRGELRRDSSTIERSEAILDYLPSLAGREGGLIFRENPNIYELRLAPEGYADP